MALNTAGTLDVYARPYVPQSLIQANQTPATIIHSTPAPWFDYLEYVDSFCPRIFLSALPTASYAPRPNMTTSKNMQPRLYSSHLVSALSKEHAALQEECDNHALYRVSLPAAGPYDPRGLIYWLYVPGLRETNLRIEVGDILCVRQLPLDVQGPPPAGKLKVKRNGNPITVQIPPDEQHNVAVWGIDRAREVLSLRIDRLIPPVLQFNVCFTVQSGRMSVLHRALQDAQEQINGEEAGWMRRMLYPESSHGRLQTTLNSMQFDFKPHDRLLNYEQLRAVDTVLKDDYGRVPYVISGPPGTGKTKTVVEMALQLLSQSDSARLLLCAPSDSAADTLLQRLSKHLHPMHLLRLNSPGRSFPEVSNTILPFCYVESDMFSIPPFTQLLRTKIVVVTCRDAEMLHQARLTNRDLHSMERRMHSTLHPTQMNIKPVLHWTGLIMDEAAQATEPEALLPLLVVAPPHNAQLDQPKLAAVVLVGDQHQLGPRTASKGDIQVSLFERLLACPLYANHPLARSAQSHGIMRPLTRKMLPITRPPFANLVRNYRSHAAILATPSALFYTDTLEPCAEHTDSLLAWPGFPNAHMPVLFAPNSSEDEVEVLDGGGWYNHGEAQRALAYARSLLAFQLPDGSPLTQSEIVIMSPFRAQVRLLRSLARQSALGGVNIGPLEAFQGLESRVVVLCTTRTRSRFVDQDVARGLGVLHEPKRFNVALTRAKEALVVIGNPEVLGIDESWVAFLAFCKRNGCWEGDGGESWEDGLGAVSRLEKQMNLRAAKEGVDDVIHGVRRLGVNDDEEHLLWEAGVAAQAALEAEEAEEEEKEDEEEKKAGEEKAFDGE